MIPRLCDRCGLEVEIVEGPFGFCRCGGRAHDSVAINAALDDFSPEQPEALGRMIAQIFRGRDRRDDTIEN